MALPPTPANLLVVRRERMRHLQLPLRTAVPPRQPHVDRFVVVGSSKTRTQLHRLVERHRCLIHLAAPEAHLAQRVQHHGVIRLRRLVLDGERQRLRHFVLAERRPHQARHRRARGRVRCQRLAVQALRVAVPPRGERLVRLTRGRTVDRAVQLTSRRRRLTRRRRRLKSHSLSRASQACGHTHPPQTRANRHTQP